MYVTLSVSIDDLVFFQSAVMRLSKDEESIVQVSNWVCICDMPTEFQGPWMETISKSCAFALPCPAEVERWGKGSVLCREQKERSRSKMKGF